MGWNLKRDKSERPMVQALRQVGCRVLQLDKFDLLVLHRGRLFMLDAKTGKGKATEAQDALIRDGWPLVYVADVEAALRAVGVEVR
jgi:hypothetical protein